MPNLSAVLPLRQEKIKQVALSKTRHLKPHVLLASLLDKVHVKSGEKFKVGELCTFLVWKKQFDV